MGDERKRGGQPGNTNGIKHGLRASGLPEKCSYIEAQLRTFRRYLVDELEDRHGRGQLSTYQHAVIQSAIRHETRALLAARWLRLDCGSLPVGERLNVLATVSRATDDRDKCLERLGLNAPATAADDPYAIPLDRLTALPPTAPAGPPPPAPAGDAAAPNTNQDQ